jgi:hypothetical protein
MGWRGLSSGFEQEETELTEGEGMRTRMEDRRWRMAGNGTMRLGTTNGHGLGGNEEFRMQNAEWERVYANLREGDAD